MSKNKTAALYKLDLQASPTEFPVTTMSEALADAIESALPSLPQPINHALDLGTGSGVHAAVLSARGVSNILATDISGEAVALAEARFQRLKSQLGVGSTPKFEKADLNDLEKQDGLFDFITTNPPSFYSGSPTISNPSPVQTGVFDTTPTQNAPSESFLYQFFQKVVSKRLATGGVVLCTWPGLQHRLVHPAKTSSAIVHPATLLSAWFGWDIPQYPRCWKHFYRYTAQIRDYGLGPDFLARLNSDINRGDLYSGLLKPGSARTNYLPSYRFGLLGLKRESTNRFSVIEFDDEKDLVAGVANV